MNYAMSISTYFRENLNKERLRLFKESFNSLLDSNFGSFIFVIDDGSDTKEHLQYLRSLNDNRIKIIEKNENTGYSRTKNLGIKTILDNGFEFGFLCDDDILYKKDWFKVYIEAYERTQYPHFCFYDHEYDIHIKQKGETFKKNGFTLRKTPMLQGGLLTFSKQLIEEVGYIKVFPRKLGHEHTHWTLKIIKRGIIPGFIDIDNSLDYLGYCDKSGTITTRPDDFEQQAAENSKFMYKGFETNEPCII